MKEKFQKIGDMFRLPGVIDTIDVVKRGNINSTYCVTYDNDGRKKCYMFQKVNTFVFKDPVQIMENIDHVTSHILTAHAGSPALHFHHTADGENFIFDEDGSFWRVMNAVDSVTFDTCDDLEIIRNTGEAFGRFQMQLADFDASLLHETIPNFHNTKKRLDTLFEHVAEDPCGRAALVADEIAYIASVRERAGELSVRYAAGAVLDVSAGVPDIEDIQIDGATLRFTRAQDASAPWQAANVSRISGTVTVDASNWASGKTPGRIMLMTVDPDAVDATFALTGLSQASTLSFDRSSGLLAIDTLSGTIIVIR